MSEVQLLFVVLAALYGWECACWVRRGAVAFSTWLGGGWRVWHPGTLIGNQSGGFILAPPLPPLGTLFLGHQSPVSLSAEGVLAFVATNVNPGFRPAQSGRFVPFDEIRDTCARRNKVLVNGELLVTCASPGLARRCVEQLRQIAGLESSQREAAITDSYRRAFDIGAAERRREEFQGQVRAVRVLCNGVLAYVFVAAPLVIWQFGFKLSWLALLAGLLGLTGATSVFFYRAHRALYPDAEDERFTQTLTILLAPTTAMRAHDALSRPLLEEFHPLVLGRVFLAPNQFRDFARRVVLDLRQPALPHGPNDLPAAGETERWARRTLQREAEEFLRASGMEPAELCQPPAPADDSCRAYCPRCNAQFTTAEGSCADCGGLARVPFRPAG